MENDSYSLSFQSCFLPVLAVSDREDTMRTIIMCVILLVDSSLIPTFLSISKPISGEKDGLQIPDVCN